MFACFSDQSTYTEDVHSIQPRPSSSNATQPVVFLAVKKALTQRMRAKGDPVVNQEKQDGGRNERAGVVDRQINSRLSPLFPFGWVW